MPEAPGCGEKYEALDKNGGVEPNCDDVDGDGDDVGLRTLRFSDQEDCVT